MAGTLAELMVSVVGDISDVRQAFSELDQSVAGFGSSMSKLGSDMQSLGTKMSTYVTAPLTAFGALSFKTAMDFDDSMRQVQAVTGSTGDSLDLLRETALQLGADTSFSSSQAAEAMYELGQAGFSVEEIIANTDDILALAASSTLDLGTAAEIAGNVINGFGLGIEDTAEVVDVLAKASATTNADVVGLGEAMSYAAPMASSLGLTIEETAAMIGLMSDAGIEGSRAGTALNGAMAALISPSSKAAEALGKYGISLEDVNPATHTFTEILGVLEDAGISATDVITIFGREAGPGVTALLSSGTDSIHELAGALEDSEGAAKQMAETMEGGVGGAWRQFTGSVETLSIKLGDLVASGFQPVLKHATDLFNRMSSLPEPILLLIVAIAGLVAAIGPVLVAGGALISSIGTITTAIAGAGGLSAALTTIVGILTGPVAIAIAAFAAAAYVVYKNWDTVGPQVISVFNRIRDSIQPLIEQVQVFISNALDRLRMWWATNGPAIQQAATTVFNTIAGVIGWLVDNVLPHMVSMFQSHFNTVTSILQYVGSFIGNVIMLVVHLINGDWSAAWTSARDIVSTVWEAIKGIVSAAINSVLNTISSVMASIRTTVQTIWTAILGIVTGVLTSISGNVSTLWNSILSFITSVLNNIRNTVQNVWNTILSTIRSVLNSIHNTASNIWNSILNTITSVLNNIRNTSQTTWNSIHSTISNIINSIQNTITRAWNTILNTARSTFDSIRSAISERLNRILSAIQNIIERIKSIWSSGLGDLVGIASSVMGKVASAISGSGSSLASAASSAGQRALDALSQKLGQMQSMYDTMKSIQSRISSISSSGSSSGGSSGSSGSTGIKRQGKEGTGEENVKIREAHATGGIAGYTGWHWMEEGELAVPASFDWDKLLVTPISESLIRAAKITAKAIGSGILPTSRVGSSVTHSYAGNTITIQNVTLTPDYNFEQLMSDIDRNYTQTRFRRGVLL